jgi:DNA-binding CsgD family transcriptional regulator
MGYNYFDSNISALEYAREMVSLMKYITKPLFANTPINNFSFLRFDHQANLINLTTDIKWIEYRFDKKIKYQILFEKQLVNSSLNKPHMYLWPNIANNELMAALQNYGIWNGCNIYIPYADQIEVFSFASSISNTNMSNFYFNYFDFLNSFIIYFKNKLSSFDLENKKGVKIITDISFPIINSDTNKSIKLNLPTSSFISKSDKFEIDNGIYLSYKELECCYYRMNGYSYKAIANILHLSSRTIESHINSSKQKTNKATTDDLLQYLNEKRWFLNAVLYK